MVPVGSGPARIRGEEVSREYDGWRYLRSAYSMYVGSRLINQGHSRTLFILDARSIDKGAPVVTYFQGGDQLFVAGCYS